MRLLPQTGILVSVFLFLSGCASRQADKNSTTETDQNKAMSNFEFSFNSAHPNAQALMADEFYWSPIEETAPFGSDDGSDAAYGFRDWRHTNKTGSAVSYLKNLITDWNYPYYDYTEIDTIKIKEYITRPVKLDEAHIQQLAQQLREADKKSPVPQFDNLDDKQLREFLSEGPPDMGASYLRGIDNAIIGTTFAQFALEGAVDTDIKELGIIAIKRQLLPLLVDGYADGYKDIRKQQLTKMLEVLNKIDR